MRLGCVGIVLLICVGLWAIGTVRGTSTDEVTLEGWVDIDDARICRSGPQIRVLDGTGEYVTSRIFPRDNAPCLVRLDIEVPAHDWYRISVWTEDGEKTIGGQVIDRASGDTTDGFFLAF